METKLYWGAFVFGLIGGCLPLLLPLAKKKKSSPAEVISKEDQIGRFIWLVAKLTVSMLVTLIVTFWFMDDAVAQRLTHNKMIFIQLVTGSMPLPILAFLQDHVFDRIKNG